MPSRCLIPNFTLMLTASKTYNIPRDKPILLFDGVCNLCEGTVKFVVKRDKKAVFNLSSLQSEAGTILLKEFGLPANYVNSFILIDKEKIYTHSSASLQMFKRLGGLWSLLYVFIIVPRPIRDWVYKLIAKNRYRWFGKKDACLIPSPELKKRFL